MIHYPVFGSLLLSPGYSGNAQADDLDRERRRGEERAEEETEEENDDAYDG